jgi:glycosyltransferase involved in cell wall biosynthesis
MTEKNSIAVVGNYAPRQCGIATFTTDLVQALCKQTHPRACWAAVINDIAEGYAYPAKVRFEINQQQLSEYRLAAEFLNINKADVVCVQHEYGIFGGQAGSYILNLLAELRLPVVTTLHTVLAEPNDQYRSVMLRLAELSDRLVVMSQKASDILQSVYAIDSAKITYIPHGIPDIPFVDPSYYKEQFNVVGKKMLLTFGLLSSNKGIEYVIRALPEVVERFPDVVYVVLGATHPHVLQADGDEYRLSLQQLVQKLGLEKHVVFQHCFVKNKELTEYLAAADIYITPYIEQAQITSGTLAYAMGAGKAVVSTPYWYAQEMLADERGLLVPFKDPQAISEALIDLLSNEQKRQAIRKRAYDYCRDAIWDNVALSYLKVFNEVKTERKLQPHPSRFAPRDIQETVFSQDLPPLKLDHLVAMTDDTGMFQHAKFTVANREHGYCVDDNARALIIAAEAQSLMTEASSGQLCHCYLAFLLHAFDRNSGRFRNFMSYDRRWTETVGSEDSHGRAIWGLGASLPLLVGSRNLPMISTLFKQALPAVETFLAPRSIAFSLIGIDAYLLSFSGDTEARRVFTVLAERLYKQFVDQLRDDWVWPERLVTYDNGKLPQALIVAGKRLQNDNMAEVGMRSLKWLFDIQMENDHFVPIGNDGWYKFGQHKARFDQQPLEAQAMLEACIAAYQFSLDKQWLGRAMTAFSWFLGHNDLNLPLYDAKTGGCRDGLQSTGVNENQGAESSLAWLIALAQLHRFRASEVLAPDAKQHSMMSRT